MTPTIYITTALIGAFAALMGVGVKMLYDSVADRTRRRREDNSLLLTERKAAFDQFLADNHRMMRYRERLHKLTEMAMRGEEAPDGLLENFPESPMTELVDSLNHVRRLARSYSVIHAADSIVRLYGDMSTAEKNSLGAPTDPNNDITWFLLCRFAEDREREFVYAYRAELGIGAAPAGAPIGYMSPRHPQLNRAEAVLRTHMKLNRDKE